MPEPTKPKPPDAAQEILNSQLAAEGIDPKLMKTLLAVAAQMAGTMAHELRKPSPEEQAELDKERERIRNARMQAAAQGKQVTDEIKRQQASCAHTKPNGDHTWRGQVHGDGWASVRCVRCLKSYRVFPTPDMVANGLNLNEVKGLTEVHLRDWAKNSAKLMEHYAQRAQPAMRPFATESATGL